MIEEFEDLCFEYFKTLKYTDFELIDCVPDNTSKFAVRIAIEPIKDKDVFGSENIILLTNNYLKNDEMDLIIITDDYKWSRYFENPAIFRMNVDGVYAIKNPEFIAWLENLFTEKLNEMYFKVNTKTIKSVSEKMKILLNKHRKQK